jgi:hemin uptake protein HemP
MATTPDDGKSTDPEAAARRSIAVVNRCIDSRDLFVATREITIVHAGETYRLRLTAQNKLILTK